MKLIIARHLIPCTGGRAQVTETETGILIENGLIRRVEALVDGTDLSPFYNKKRNLFSIGYDSETGELSASC